MTDVEYVGYIEFYVRAVSQIKFNFILFAWSEFEIVNKITAFPRNTKIISSLTLVADKDITKGIAIFIKISSNANFITRSSYDVDGDRVYFKLKYIFCKILFKFQS